MPPVHNDALRILIAPDSFKETLSAREAADIMAREFEREIPHARCTTLPLADGGEGTAATLTDALGGAMHFVSVEDALGRSARAGFGVTTGENTRPCAFVDAASAVGLEAVAVDERKPLLASSYGLGQLLRAVHTHMIQTYGEHRIVVGLGGTATMDGGVGLAQALGVRIVDEYGNDVPRGARAMAMTAGVDTSTTYLFEKCVVTAAVDVRNPLLGARGAARVFGPQKGADADMVELLEAGMVHFAHAVYDYCAVFHDANKFNRQVNFPGAGLTGISVSLPNETVTKNNLQNSVKHGFDQRVNFPGAGAAGGLGMALSVFCGARITGGIQTVLDHCNFDNLVQNANLVITGEGKIDGQSAGGKVPFGVLQAARARKVPVIVLAGAVDQSAEIFFEHGARAIFSCTLRSRAWSDIQRSARESLIFTARSVARTIAGGYFAGV